jgi:hypothetical protein
MATNVYQGEMTRQEGLEQLMRLAERLGIAAGDIKIRPLDGSRAGMTLSFLYRGVTIVRSCSSQENKEKNFVCLVLWLGDLVRNIERRIETIEEAFYAEGGHQLALAETNTPFGDTRTNLYNGEKTQDESRELILRSLERLGLTENDVKVSWDADRNEVRLRLRLRSGTVVEKVSQRQPDVRRNLAVLALWLQTRAKNWERGIERDMDQLFAANLLPPAS